VSPVFFADGAAFRAWLEKNHGKETELLLGFYKVGAKKKGITYKQALDCALCFGWIDGVRKSLDEKRWTIRFTPRKPRSNWSQVNIRRMEELLAEGRVAAPGKKAFETRAASRPYSFETAPLELSPAFKKKLAANKKVAADFASRSPGYQRTAAFWVMSAKKEETRQKRLAVLVDCCARGVKIPPLGY
jgi:uncharacterized protein YdeI (YjbR/CyaY-like superfamily)